MTLDASKGDTLVITYFNVTSGKMREKSLRVTEVNDDIIHLEEVIGPSQYRYRISDEKLDMKREDGDWTPLGKDCTVEIQ